MSPTPKSPPRYIPTLTEVVRVEPTSVGVPAGQSSSQMNAIAFEEQLVHRVLQRVDLLIEARLQGALRRVIEEQTRSLLPRLSEEIESEIRSVVSEAIAKELVRP